MANLNVDGDGKVKTLPGADPLTVAGLKICANVTNTNNYLSFTNADANTLWGNFSADSSGNLTWSGSLVGGLTLSTAKSATGTSVDFTDIPSWVKRVTISFFGVSLSTVSTNPGPLYLIQLGTSSGFVTNNYRSSATEPGNGSAQSTLGLILMRSNAIVNLYTGNYQIINFNGNTWIGSGIISPMNGVGHLSAGDVSISGQLTQLRITTVNGTDNFDAGTINIMYEG